MAVTCVYIQVSMRPYWSVKLVVFYPPWWSSGYGAEVLSVRSSNPGLGDFDGCEILAAHLLRLRCTLNTTRWSKFPQRSSGISHNHVVVLGYQNPNIYFYFSNLVVLYLEQLNEQCCSWRIRYGWLGALDIFWPYHKYTSRGTKIRKYSLIARGGGAHISYGKSSIYQWSNIPE